MTAQGAPHPLRSRTARVPPLSNANVKQTPPQVERKGDNHSDRPVLGLSGAFSAHRGCFDESGKTLGYGLDEVLKEVFADVSMTLIYH